MGERYLVRKVCFGERLQYRGSLWCGDDGTPLASVPDLQGGGQVVVLVLVGTFVRPLKDAALGRTILGNSGKRIGRVFQCALLALTHKGHRQMGDDRGHGGTFVVGRSLFGQFGKRLRGGVVQCTSPPPSYRVVVLMPLI